MTLLLKVLQNKYFAPLLSLCFLVLFCLPSKSFENSPQISDKLVHAGLFFTLTFSWAMWLKNLNKAAIFMLLYGIGTEIIQYMLPQYFNRSFELLDIIADSIGVLLAWLVLSKYKERLF
jgi:VanZ family protein